MAAEQGSPEATVVYESTHVGVAHRVAVALGSGLVVFAAMSFLRWGCSGVGVDRRGLVSGLVVGGLVALGLVVAALRSRVAWRVTLDPASAELRIDRDPGVTERWPLRELADARALPVAGGWSRDPAERLSLVFRDGSERVFGLPDDALTEGIARDIRAARSALEAGEQRVEDAPGLVAGSREVGE